MKMYEGGNAFLNDDGTPQTRAINQAELKATLQYISTRLGMPMASEMNKSGGITRYGIEDSLLGSAAKANDGTFGKKTTMNDIDIAIDSERRGFDEMLSLVVQKFGAENVGKPMKGMGTIPTRVPVNGTEDGSVGYVQVDFMIGDPKLLTFTYKAPDMRSGTSKFSGAYRNMLMSSILQNLRRQVRNTENQEIIALVGPSLLLNRGIINQWRHFPLRKDNNGRLTSMKAISRAEFDNLYPEHKGKEREMTLTSPNDIVDFIFPKAGMKPTDIDSFEELRDAVIRHMPDQAENIFNRTIATLHDRGYETPEGLVVETLQMLEKANLLHEVREHSMSMVTESLVTEESFEGFRASCGNLVRSHKRDDHFTKPKPTADVLPQEGYVYLIKKCGMDREWEDVCKKQRLSSDMYTECQSVFFEEFCDLLQKDDFFFVLNHYSVRMTPESFIYGLIDLEPVMEAY